MINYVRTMVVFCISFLVFGAEVCEPPNTTVENKYPGCLSTSNKTYNLEHDHMTGYDALISGYVVDDAFDGAKVTVTRDYGDENGYALLDCEGNAQTRNQLLIDYTNENFDNLSTNGVHGYMASIESVANDPNPDIGGICVREASHVNPAFVYVLVCHNAQPTFGDIYAAGIFVHELMHQIAIVGHPSHEGENEGCCIIRESYPNGYCQVTNVVICDGHRCTINNATWPRY